MFKKEYFSIANCVTSLRLIGAIVLIFIEPLSVPFYIIYSICGLSDAVDGFIARKTNTVSKFGSKLDSVSDLTFYAVMIIKLIALINEKITLWIWIYIGLTIAIRLSCYIVSAVKKKTFASMHTYLNKLTGFLVFVVPFILPFDFFFVYSIIVTTVAFMASTQELIKHIKSKPDDIETDEEED